MMDDPTITGHPAGLRVDDTFISAIPRDPLTRVADDIRELKSSVEHLTRAVERLADVEMRKELDDELVRLGLHDIRGIVPANRHVPRGPDEVWMMWALPGWHFDDAAGVLRGYENAPGKYSKGR